MKIPPKRTAHTFLFISFFTLTAPINCWPLFAYSSYNFYGSAICIKAVYSRYSHCNLSLPWSKMYKFESFDRFWLYRPKSD